MLRENVLRRVELAIRMNTHPCPHTEGRSQADCTLCLAETAVQAIENQNGDKLPWNTRFSG